MSNIDLIVRENSYSVFPKIHSPQSKDSTSSKGFIHTVKFSTAISTLAEINKPGH